MACKDGIRLRENESKTVGALADGSGTNVDVLAAKRDYENHVSRCGECTTNPPKAKFFGGS
jgi:hypothetical protein